MLHGYIRDCNISPLQSIEYKQSCAPFNLSIPTNSSYSLHLKLDL